MCGARVRALFEIPRSVSAFKGCTGSFPFCSTASLSNSLCWSTENKRNRSASAKNLCQSSKSKKGVYHPRDTLSVANRAKEDCNRTRKFSNREVERECKKGPTYWMCGNEENHQCRSSRFCTKNAKNTNSPLLFLACSSVFRFVFVSNRLHVCARGEGSGEQAPNMVGNLLYVPLSLIVSTQYDLIILIIIQQQYIAKIMNYAFICKKISINTTYKKT